MHKINFYRRGMKIARCAATAIAGSTPPLQNCSTVVHEAEEVTAEEMDDELEVEGVVKEDVGEAEAGELREVTAKANKVPKATELSLEAVITEKEEEAGRELNAKEREYLSLQLEKQRILQISVSMRGEEDKKRYKAIRNRLENLKHLQEFLKLPSKACKSAAQRMKIYRGKISNDTIEDDRAKACNQSSLEATLGQKAEEAGKELEDDEQEYVRLQFERNSLMRQYPNASDRNKEVVDRTGQSCNGEDGDDDDEVVEARLSGLLEECDNQLQEDGVDGEGEDQDGGEGGSLLEDYQSCYGGEGDDADNRDAAFVTSTPLVNRRAAKSPVAINQIEVVTAHHLPEVRAVQDQID